MKSMKTPYLLLIIQFGIVAIFATVLIFAVNYHAAIATFFGGLAGIIPNIYFIWKVFGKEFISAKAVIKNFFIGEFVKLFLGAIFLVLLARFANMPLFYLIIGYLVTFLAVFFLPMLTKNL
jgi:ATP synthase protein I